MNTTPRRPHHPGCHPICQPFAATALAVATLLTGCGSDDDAPAAPTTQEVKTSVIDGAIQNATVCLDKNNNSACDTDEPTARTAANGSATLQVPPEDVGKFTLLALVGTDAIDAVSGPVPTAYVLRTPADRTALISPLTTLVKARMDLAGGSSGAADQALQDAAGLSASLFTDFTTSADTAALAAMARLVVAAKQQASTALAGAQVTAAEMDRAINQRLLDLLPSLVAAAHDDAVAKTTGSAQQAAVNGAAQGLVSQELGLTAALLPTVVGSARSVEPTSTTPEAGAMLAWLTFTDGANWFMRYFDNSAAQNTPDANGQLRYVDHRKRAVNGAVQVYGADPAFMRSDAWFNGTAWTVCPAGYEHLTTPRDAQGRSESLYCGTHRSTSVRTVRDLAGLRMADVVAEIRAYPLASTQGAYPQWGPRPELLGTATFPAGSKLYYQVSTPLANPDGYNTLASNVARAFTAEIAAGGTGTPACNSVTSANAASLQSEVTTLEQLVAGFPGKPCLYTPNATTGPRSEWWGNSSLSIGTVPGAAPVTPYYRSDRGIRMAFSGGNQVTYLNCALRASDASPRNCDVAGTGSYSIETVGDARVMRLAQVPADATRLNYSRIFVERGGKVYYGYRDKLRIDNALRLNGEGMDAMFAQLGLTR